jgi:hypothetical protein
MDQATQARAFEPFFTTKRVGQAHQLPPGSNFLPKPFTPDALLAKVRAARGANGA